jgi:hypothetical protein
MMRTTIHAISARIGANRKLSSRTTATIQVAALA